MEALGEDIRELGRRGDADEQHLAILNNLVGEVPPDVDVRGPFASADFVYWRASRRWNAHAPDE